MKKKLWAILLMTALCLTLISGSAWATDGTINVNFQAVDSANNAALEGAYLQILNSKGKVIDEWTSTTQARTAKDIKMNETYTLHASVAPDGYTIAADTTFSIDKNGMIISSGTIDKNGVMLVEFAKTSVNIAAVDVDDGAELEGAAIQIIDSRGNVVEEWVSTDSAHNVAGLSTEEQYTLRTTVAPDGYTIAVDTTFSIDKNGMIISSGTIDKNGVMLVEFAKTSVKIAAVDIDDGAELEGATIQILDSKGNAVEEWVSTDSAHNVAGLSTNEVYTLRTAISPDGYTIATDTTFFINKNGKVITTGSLSEDEVMLVEFARTSVKIAAVDIDDGAELAGATIQILDSKGNAVEEWVSTDSVHNVAGLSTNEVYTLRTPISPDGYTIATDTVFSIDENGKVTTTGSLSEDEVMLVEFARTSVKIAAVDIDDGAELAGATIQIIDSKGNAVEEWVSSTQAHTVECLKTRKNYTLHTTVAPSGYTLAADSVFFIDENGKVTTSGSLSEDEVMLVEFARTSVKIAAVDIDDGAELAGATIQILDRNENVVEEWVSTDSAHNVTGLKIEAEYTLRTISAPNGYTIAADTTFSIDRNGIITFSGTVDHNGIMLAELAKSIMRIAAVDAEDSKMLSGATLQIIDSDSNIVKEWSSGTDAMMVEGLATGAKYTLRTTAAPEGYKLPADVTFLLDEYGNLISSGTIDENGVLLARLCKIKMIMVTVATEGSGIASADKTVCEEGSLISLTAAPERGWLFKEWVIVSGDAAWEGASLRAGMQDIQIKAVFVPAAAPEIITPQDNQTIQVFVGGTAGMSVEAKNAASCQWMLSSDGGSTWNEIKGANEASLVISSATLSQNGHIFKCVFTSADGVVAQSPLFTLEVLQQAALPQTGDNSFMALWAAVMSLCLSGMAMLHRRAKRV